MTDEKRLSVLGACLVARLPRAAYYGPGCVGQCRIRRQVIEAIDAALQESAR